jgi:lipoprotein NlpI
MSTPTTTAQTYYQRGVEKRQQGDLGGARNDFSAALACDPAFGEAQTALEMLDSILRFGNPQQHNV